MAIRKETKKKTKSKVFATRPVESPAEKRRRWLRYGAVVIAAVAMVIAMTREPKRQTLPFDDIKKVVASEDIRASFFFESVDLQKTVEARRDAAAKVPEHHRVDTARVDAQSKLLAERILRVEEQRPRVTEAVRAALGASGATESPGLVARDAVSKYVTELKSNPEWERMPDAALLSLWLTPDTASLPQRELAPAAADTTEESPRPVVGVAETGSLVFSYGDRLSDLAQEGLQYVLSTGVRSSGLPPDGGSKPIIVVSGRPIERAPDAGTLVLADVPDPAAAEEELAARLRDTAKRAAKDTDEPTEWGKLYEAAFAMAQPLLTDTLRVDEYATERAREQARETVAPVMRGIEAGEIIQEGGRRWTEQSREDARIYLALLQKNQEPSRRVLARAAAHTLIVLLVIVGLFRSIDMLRPSQAVSNRWTHVLLALLILTVTLVVGRIAWYFEPSGFVLPVAAGGILYAILVNGRMAAMISGLCVVLVSAQYGYDWRLLVVHLAMSLAGVFSIYNVRRRSDMAGASLKATLAGAIAMCAITLAMDSPTSSTALQRMLMVVLNGGICIMAVPALLSPLERLFGITTDIQLLEYSDLNNEVLSKLAIKVPATYAHSLMLGQLAEAAADAIGANGLKARVCAYYHDIGKSRRPEYFIENQTGVNIHDDLSPRLSARAIAAHVTQGAEMAREARLPKPIVDGILEHHGTTLIGFFYSLAQKQDKHGDVDEKDFRYPGPKPQSPETAILMICDAVESGVRSIKNPNEERVREFVDKIVSARAADRQFDDCNLTLRQLNVIAETVTQRMVSNLHGRISYPDPKSEREDDNIIPLPGGAGH